MDCEHTNTNKEVKNLNIKLYDKDNISSLEIKNDEYDFNYTINYLVSFIENVEKCEFIKYCKDNSENLPEPLWHAMITNLAPLKNSSNAIHEFSRSYSKYSFDETERKIQRAIIENKPHTCEYIRENLNFDCNKNCHVKAPIVYGLPSFEERISEIISSDKINVDEILSKENLKICAWAKLNLPSEYVRLKAKLKGKVNLKDFEKTIRFESKKKDENDFHGNLIPLDLKDINLSGAVVPSGWKVSMKQGIQKIVRGTNSDELLGVCICPIVITKRLENFDDGTEKIELSFFRDGHWKRLIAPRSSVFNRTSIIKYADSGLPVSSKNAADIVAYFSDYENANLNVIPLVKSISRVGWLDSSSFFPYKVDGNIVFESEMSEVDAISQGTVPRGDIELWKKYAAKIRKNPFARFIISASFASPLLKLIENRVFFIHIWHDSQSGKTAVIKFAVSVWGDPAKLMGSFNATSVGLERMAGTLKHLPFAIDELQVLNEHKISAEKIVYGLANGFGRLRGNKTGGMQSVLSWQSIMLTSGEQPMSNESSNDGAITRVLELYGKPVDKISFAHDVHTISGSNYALAGKKFIEFIVDNVSEKIAKEDYKKLLKEIDLKCDFEVPRAQLDNVSAVCLGDYYAEVSVFNTPKNEAWSESIELGTQILENCKELQKADTVNRAWDFVMGWIASNKNRFSPDSTPCYGKFEKGRVYIIPNVLRQALKENGFDYSKVTRGFKDRNFIETCFDSNGCIKMQVQKKINGINQRCFCVKWVTDDEVESNTNPLV